MPGFCTFFLIEETCFEKKRKKYMYLGVSLFARARGENVTASTGLAELPNNTKAGYRDVRVELSCKSGVVSFPQLV